MQNSVNASLMIGFSL